MMSHNKKAGGAGYIGKRLTKRIDWDDTTLFDEIVLQDKIEFLKFLQGYRYGHKVCLWYLELEPSKSYTDKELAKLYIKHTDYKATKNQDMDKNTAAYNYAENLLGDSEKTFGEREKIAEYFIAGATWRDSSISPDELWDSFSEYIGDSISELEHVAGQSVLTRAQFNQLFSKLKNQP